MFFLPEAIAFPPDLDEALAGALRISGAGRLDQNGKALASLWPKLAKKRGQAQEGETHYSFLRAEAEAYAAYYLPANALKVALVLEEAHLLGLDPLPGPPARWLDLGTGPGTAFWGLAWWARHRGRRFQFIGWDQSAAFREIAERAASARPFGFSASFLDAGERQTLETTLAKSSPTHVSFVNSVAEIFPDPKERTKELAAIWARLRTSTAKDGRPRFLLLIEPGSRESSRELARLKDEVQATAGPALWLPCLDARPCGALKEANDWCHEEVSCEFPGWLNELGARAGLRKEALIFSYALFATCGPAAELARGGRVVSQRLERKGQVECRLCTTEGKCLVRAQRSKVTDENRFLLEVNRGDLWREFSLAEKGDLLSAARREAAENTIFRAAFN